MSRTTKEINKVTTTIIRMSFRVLIYAFIFFLMYEGITRGYSYGHEIFSPAAMEQEPGREIAVVVKQGESVSEVAKELKRKGLIKDELVFIIQSKLFEYRIHPGVYALKTSMTSIDMLKLIDKTKSDEESKAKDKEDTGKEDQSKADVSKAGESKAGESKAG